MEWSKFTADESMTPVSVERNLTMTAKSYACEELPLDEMGYLIQFQELVSGPGFTEEATICNFFRTYKTEK